MSMCLINFLIDSCLINNMKWRKRVGDKRDKQREDRKNQILSISLDMFIKKGYFGTSTRGIAAQAGISSGLIFNYFESKDDIYETLIDIGCAKMTVDYETALQNPYKYIWNMIDGVFSQLDTNPFFAKMFVFMDQAQHTVGISIRSIELLKSMDVLKNYGPIIECGQNRKQFREGNVNALTVALLSAIQGIAQERVRSQDMVLPKVEWIMDILTGGMMNDEK